MLRYAVVDDVGTVINRLTLEGQIHRRVVQGIGQAFTEHLVYDRRSGQLLSGSFMDYGLLRADEVCFVEMEENPVPTKTNPLLIWKIALLCHRHDAVIVALMASPLSAIALWASLAAPLDDPLYTIP